MSSNFTVTDDNGKLAYALRLNALGELFEAPPLDPFVEQLRTTSGVEDMIADLSTRRLRNPLPTVATLQLPRAVIATDTAATAHTAMQRYCDAQIAAAQRAIAANNFNGRTKLPIGLLASGVMVVALFVLLWLLPENLQPLIAVLAPIVTIASWAAIWNPVETLLYENWEERRAVQMHTTLREMDIKVIAAD